MTKFQKGKSGNPKGKAPGTPDKRTEYREMLRPHAGALLQKAVDMALEGDTAALKLCIDKLVPSIKPTGEPVTAALPTTGTIAERGAALYEAVARGELTTDEGAAMMQVLQGLCRVKELSEMEERLSFLEGKQNVN